MYLSDYIKDDRKGHVNFEFVDVQLDSDNRIFIDPVYWKTQQMNGA